MKVAIHRASNINDSMPLPIYLRATGWHVASQGWTESNDGKNRNHAGLFWCMNGSGNFIINDELYTLKAKQVLYYLPHEATQIIINSSQCTYYWTTFDGLLTENFLKSFKYPRAPFYTNECLVSHFEDMFEILYDVTPAGLQRGSLAVHRLLIKLGNHALPCKNSRHHQLTKDFIELTAENFKNKSYNVYVAAEILKVHRTSLGRALKKQLNITPNTYINNIRLQYALKLLYETDLKAVEIAEVCGIPNSCYFSKLIKQFTGLPPHRFRNS